MKNIEVPFTLYNGDCLEQLKLIPDNTIASVVTDPPYHLTTIGKKEGKKGFLGSEWDGGDIAFRTDVWNECLRVLKPGGYLLSFSAARNYHRMATAIEDSGFEIRDQIMWIYASGFPKNHDIGKAVDKIQGNKRKIVGNKPYKSGKLCSEGLLGGDYRTINRIQLKETVGNSEWEGWGTALKPSHEPIVVAKKPLSECSIAQNVLKWNTGGINIKDSLIPALENEDRSKGRWPMNVIFNESPKESWSKYFYCVKPSKKEKEIDCDVLTLKTVQLSLKNIHPTVKPLELMDYLVRLVTPPGEITLDPFMGSGTTGISAVRNGFRFIGIERESEYFELAKARLECFIKRSA